MNAGGVRRRVMVDGGEERCAGREHILAAAEASSPAGHHHPSEVNASSIATAHDAVMSIAGQAGKLSADYTAK